MCFIEETTKYLEAGVFVYRGRKKRLKADLVEADAQEDG